MNDIRRYVVGTPQRLLDQDHLWGALRAPLYAFESPLEATLNYIRAYRRAHAHTFGLSPDFDEQIVIGSDDWITVVEMRQMADVYSIAEYGDILRIAFSMNRRNYKGSRKPGRFRNLRDLPTFNRKFHKERLRFHASIVGLIAPARLSMAAYAALPSQKVYRQRLLGSANVSHSWPSLVEAKVLRERILTMDDVKGALRDLPTNEIATAVDRIKSGVRLPTDEFKDPVVSADNLVEICFGLPSTRTNRHCATCPLRERCHDLASDLRPLVPAK